MVTAPIAANDNVRQFYVYQHRRNDTGAVFYVGKGWNKPGDPLWKRAHQTDRSHRNNPHWQNIVNKHGRTVEIVCDGLDEKHAFELETMLISALGRRDNGNGDLVNLTDGGEGLTGYSPTKETRANLSASLRKRYESPEARILTSSSLREALKTPENRRRKSDAMRAVWMSSGHRDKVADGQRSANSNVAVMRRRSKANVERFENPGARLVMAVSARNSPPHTDNKTGLKGVSLHKDTGKWVARLSDGGKPRYLGIFSAPEEAARAYDAAAIAAWGAGNCYLNFPAEHLQAA